MKPPQRRPIRIFLPKDFKLWTDEEARQYLVGAAVSAATACGLQLAYGANDAIGEAILKRMDNGATCSAVVQWLRSGLQLAGTDHEGWGWIGTWAS